MHPQAVSRRALRRAARRLGGAPALAHLLQASPADIARWLEGEAKVPELYLIRAVEVLLADGAELAALRRRGEERARWISLDAAQRAAYLRGEALALPFTEWAVLESLSARFGSLVSLPQLRRDFELWSGGTLASAIEMYIFRLRLKLQGRDVAIRTVRPGGYLLGGAP